MVPSAKTNWASGQPSRVERSSTGTVGRGGAGTGALVGAAARRRRRNGMPMPNVPAATPGIRAPPVDTPAADPSAERRAATVGVACAGGAYLAWGLLPLYFRALKSVSAPEILAHRVV